MEYQIFGVLKKRIFHQIIVDSRKQYGKYLESILNISDLLIRGLIKGLKTD